MQKDNVVTSSVNEVGLVFDNLSLGEILYSPTIGIDYYILGKYEISLIISKYTQWRVTS